MSKIKNSVSFLWILVFFTNMFLPLYKVNAELTPYNPLVVKEFIQTDWSGGGGLSSSTDDGVGNKYNIIDGLGNIDTSIGSIKLKPGSTTDITYPSYNIMHQVNAIGTIHTHNNEIGRIFDGDTGTYTRTQGAPLNKRVGRFPSAGFTNPYLYVEPGIPQAAGTTVGAYYSMKVTLKKSTSISQIKLLFYDNDGRKFTRYMIKGSNDDQNYTLITDTGKTTDAGVTGWQNITVGGGTYKYFKFYFDGYKSTAFSDDADGDVTAGDKQNIINIKELEIYDDSSVNIARRWGDAILNPGPHHQDKIIAGNAGSQYYQRVNTAGGLAVLNTIDLLSSRALSGVNFNLSYWDIRRYYGYKIDVSNDNINWTTKIDRTGVNADPKGYIGKQEIKFSGISNWRYIRLSGWKGAFSPDMVRWNWAGDTRFNISQIEPQTPYYYASVESPVIDFGNNREFKRVTVQGDYDTFGKEVKVLIRTGDTSSFNSNYWSQRTDIMGNVPNYLQNKRYLQYKIQLLSRDANTTPRVDDLTISHKAYIQDVDTYTTSYSNDNHVPMSSDITKPVESYRYNLGGVQLKENTITEDIDKDGVVDLIMLQGGRIIAKRWYSEDSNRATPYVDDIIYDTPNRGWTRLHGLHDFNKDGKKEILLSNEVSGFLSIVDLETGNIIWTTEAYGFSKGNYERGSHNGIIVTDLEEDGFLEILYAGFGGLNSKARTKMFSFINGFSQTSTSLIADGGNLLWDAPYILRRRHTHNLAGIENFITGNNVKEIVFTDAYSLRVLNASTGELIGVFSLPTAGYDKGSEDSYIVYPNQSLNLTNMLLDGNTDKYLHVFDGSINNWDRGSSLYSQTFQKNHIIFDLGGITNFTELKANFYNDTSHRQFNVQWEGSNNWDFKTGNGTWDKITDRQLNVYGNYDDTRYCQGWCDTGAFSQKSYRFLRLKGTGHTNYSRRGMYINEIDILNNGTSIKTSIAANAKTYVFPRNASYHHSSFDAIDVDGDNIKELVGRGDRSSGYSYSNHNTWRGVYKFGPSNDLKTGKWVWGIKGKDYDGARRTNGSWEDLPMDDFDGDGKKELVTWNHGNGGIENWQTYMYDLESGDRKILKVKYKDQDKPAPGVLNGEDPTNYRLYTRYCPDNFREDYSDDDKKKALCEIATFEFDTPQTIDKINLRAHATRSIYNYKIEATKDLVNWTTVTPGSTQGNTTANFTGWSTNNITQDTYKAFRVYMSKSVNDSNPRAILSGIKIFNSGIDLTPSLKDKIYIWKKDGTLPGYWHSNSRMYGPIQNIGTDKVIPMYLGQRHGMYKINQAKTGPNGIYFDLMYNFNSTVGSNWTLYGERFNKTSDEKGLSRVKSLDTDKKIPIMPIGDGSIGDYIITDGYNVKHIDGGNGSEKAIFPYNNVGTNSLLYYGDLGKDLGIGFIQSLGDGKTRMISLSQGLELNIINTGNYYVDNTIIADINNDGVQEITTINGFNNKIVLDIGQANPIQSPNLIWSGNPGGSVYSTSDPDELVLGSDQGKDIVMTNAYPLGIVNGAFSRARHAITRSWVREHLSGLPYGDKTSKWYNTFSATYSIASRRAVTDFRYDVKNAKISTRRQNRFGFLSKKSMSSGTAIWQKLYRDIYYFHSSQNFPYDIDNDGYDDVVLNHAYHYPVFVSGRDGLVINMIQDYYTYNWHPLVGQFDSDPELELFGQTSGSYIKRWNPKNGYAEKSVEGTPNNLSTSLNHGKMGIIDIDNNGVWETFAQDINGRVMIHGKDMDLVKSFYVYDGKISTDLITLAGPAASITSIDINGDGKQNIVISSNDGYIYAINPSVDMTVLANMTGEGVGKAILWSYKVGANTSRLAFADIRNRGKTDIIFSAGDGFIRVLTQASIQKPGKVNDGPTIGVNLEFTQDITQIGANWEKVDGAAGYIVKFISDTGQEIVQEQAVIAGSDGIIPTQILVKDIGLQVGRKYFAMVKAFDGGGVSEYTISDGIEVVGFSITKQVRNASDSTSQFQDEITVGPGEMVQYKIIVTNKTNRIAGGGKFDILDPTNPLPVTSCELVTYCEDRAVVLEDYMPQGFTYIAGSTVINGYSRSNEINPFFVLDGTNTQTNLPTVAGSVLRWKLTETDLIEPYGGTLELSFTARAN